MLAVAVSHIDVRRSADGEPLLSTVSKRLTLINQNVWNADNAQRFVLTALSQTESVPVKMHAKSKRFP